MTTTAIHIQNLVKTFGKGKKRFNAVDNLTLDVQAGQVYGFLGPNGAGKTTTIRMLINLIAPTSGQVHLFGQRTDNDNRHIIYQQVGALVEGATFYPFLSGEQNLRVLAHTSGCYDPKRIDYLIDFVGMTERSKRQAKTYSTGMKQRMGIAAALLNDPQLVILDEPTNGLDPRGIQEIRQLIRRLTDEEGKTVFLSSHMLYEVEQVCDRVAIINRGQLVQEGKVSDLLAEQTALRIAVSPLDRAEAVLQTHFETQVVASSGGEQAELNVQATREQTPDIVRLLAQANVDVFHVMPQRRTLEDYFLQLTDDQDVAPRQNSTRHDAMRSPAQPAAQQLQATSVDYISRARNISTD